MTSFKSKTSLILVVLAAMAVMLLAGPRAMAQNHRQHGGNPNAVDILNGVGNMVGAIIRSTAPQNQPQRFPGYTRPQGYFPHHPTPEHYPYQRYPRVQTGYHPQTTYYVPEATTEVRTVTVSDTPSVSVNPAPQVASNPAPRADITLINPKTNGATLRYTLSGVSYSLKPGYTQQVHQQCVITFDRGGSSGVVSYTLSEGTYRFQPSEGAWELFQTDSTDESTSADSALASNPVPLS